jgi:hypothetical protein
VTLRDCSNGQIAGDGINGAGLIEEEEVQETSRSSGTGEAKIVTAENVTAENVTLQATPETNAEIVSANDVNEQPVVNRNSIMDYVWQILSWLGF